ncbi:MAG: serine hydrolase domain-containing protein [Verrucomicrobiaceae bacterium]
MICSPRHLAIAGLIALSTSALAAPPVIPEVVKANIRKRVDFGYVPGIVVTMVNPDGTTTFSYGTYSHNDPRTPDETTLYEIASVTKTLTATLLAQMVEAGDVSLSDKAADFLPAGVNMPGNGGENITLLQLATHTSGLPNSPTNLIATITDHANQFANYQISDFHHFLNTYSLPRAPGAEYEYSNTGIALLGYVLALSQDTDYESLLKSRVLYQMDMYDTGITLNEEQESRRAPGHHGVVVRPKFEMASFAPAGALQSCALDLSNYLIYQLGLQTGPITPALNLAHTQHYNIPTGQYDQGLAWWLWNGLGIIQHGGDSQGSTAFVGFKPSTQTGVAILSNNRGHAPLGVIDLGFRCLTPEQGLAPINAPLSVPEASLRNWVGNYLHASGALEMKIGLKQSRLFLEIIGQTSYTLFPANTTGRFGLPEAAFNALVQLEGESLTYTQTGGSEVPMARVRQKGKIALSQRDGLAIISVEGEGDETYPVETSTDLKTWEPLGTMSIWDPPHQESLTQSGYFRIIEP